MGGYVRDLFIVYTYMKMCTNGYKKGRTNTSPAYLATLSNVIGFLLGGSPLSFLKRPRMKIPRDMTNPGRYMKKRVKEA